MTASFRLRERAASFRMLFLIRRMAPPTFFPLRRLPFRCWLTVGWVDGIVPGFTTLAAGGLLADVTRVRAFELLGRRLKALTADLGDSLCPGVAAEIVEPGEASRH